MPKVPDPKSEYIISEQLKNDNWTFFVMASSNDPAIKCQSIDDLVSSLRATIEMAGLLYEDIGDLYIIKVNKQTQKQEPVKVKNFFEFFQWQTKGANKAWMLYSTSRDTPENRGMAVEIANNIRRDLMFLVYDDRFTKSNSNSFASWVT
jgi:hypothetical protein